MSSLSDTRAGILDAILEKYEAGELIWSPRTEPDSFETTFGDFTYHLDRRAISGRIVYRIWIFDNAGNDLDNFHSKELEEKIPSDPRFKTYWQLVNFIHGEVNEKLKVDRLLPALKQLRPNEP